MRFVLIVVMTRVQQLLHSLDWSQQRLATEVGVTQTTIWRLARGDAESGPMRLALNQIAQAHGLPELQIPRTDTVSPAALPCPGSDGLAGTPAPAVAIELCVAGAGETSNPAPQQ